MAKKETKKTKEVVKSDFDILNPIQKSEDNLPSPIEANSSFLDSLKLTYSLSGQYKDGTCKIGDFFFADESLGGDIDIYIPYYGFQVLALQNKKEFYGIQVFPHTDKTFRKKEEYKGFIADCEKAKKVKVEEGLVFLGYLPEHNAWCTFFVKGTTLRLGNKIVSNLDKGECYFQLSSREVNGENYLKTRATVLDKNEVKNFGLESEVVLNKIKTLLESGKDKDESETAPAASR